MGGPASTTTMGAEISDSSENDGMSNNTYKHWSGRTWVLGTVCVVTLCDRVFQTCVYDASACPMHINVARLGDGWPVCPA